MVALQAGTIITVPLDEACTSIKTVPVDGQLVRTARDIGISFAAPKESKLAENGNSVPRVAATAPTTYITHD